MLLKASLVYENLLTKDFIMLFPMAVKFERHLKSEADLFFVYASLVVLRRSLTTQKK